MRRLRNWIIVLGSGVLLILTGGTLGFIWIEHYPPFDAFYMTLITITTVGYGELHPLSFWGRIFNSFLIFFGVTIMLLAVGGMTQVIIELELTQYFGKRRTRKMIDKLQDHIIVCGFGRVGRGAARELQRAGVPFLIVDKSEDRVEWAIRDGMLGVLADATDDETLQQAGVLRAKGLIATLQSDADNLFVILSAKALKPGAAGFGARGFRAKRKEDAAGGRRLRVRALRYDRQSHGASDAEAARIPVHRFHHQEHGAGCRNRAVQRAGVERVCIQVAGRRRKIRRELGVIVLAIRKSDGQMLFNPPAEAEIQAGDFLIVMGEAANLRKLEQVLAEVRA